MRPVWEANPDGATSCLISGGCDPQGRMPVRAHLDQVRRWREGRRMNWHVGFLAEEELLAIAPLVDVVSFDVVGDDETASQVYGHGRTVEEYLQTYRLLRRHVRTLPHITVGLRGGELGHEEPAMEMLAREGVDGLVFLVFVPTAGTRYADRSPPAPNAVAAILAKARVWFPDVPLYLGCMRPRGRYRDHLDPLAVRAGVNTLVSPSPPARRQAAALGLETTESRECCVL
jgi:uncharacterized radical SAM superfamily protein